MKAMKDCLIRASCLCCLTAGVLAAAPQAPLAPHPRGYVALRASAPLNVDGRLDEPAWQNAAWTDPFVDIEGDLKPKPTFETRVRMLWDDTYF